MRIVIFGIFMYMAREWDDLTVEVTHKTLDDRWFALMVVGLVFCAIMDFTDLLLNLKELIYGSNPRKTNSSL